MSKRRAPISAENWNNEVPIGTTVYYFPTLPITQAVVPEITKTRSEAWELGDGTAVVKVKGQSGGVALTHLDYFESFSAKGFENAFRLGAELTDAFVVLTDKAYLELTGGAMNRIAEALEKIAEGKSNEH